MSTVSVILTSRDRFELLRHAVASVLGQSLAGIELVIVDDDSSDPRIERFLSDLSKAGLARVFMMGPVDPGVRDSCEMVGHAVNVGLEAATGEYLSLLCDDDAYLPNRCETYAAHLNAHPDVDVVVGRNRWLTVDGRRMPHSYLRRFNYARPHVPGHEGLVEMIGPPNFICHDSTMFRRTEIRWEPELQPTPVDWRFWCALYQAGKRFERIDHYGEEAYIPGTWNHATVEEAVAARGLGGDQMDEIKYAVNTSNQIQNIQLPNGTVKPVHPGEDVPASMVTNARGEMFPDFELKRTIRTPKVEGDGKMGVDMDGIPEIPEIEGSVLASEGADAKTPFKVTVLGGDDQVDEEPLTGHTAEEFVKGGIAVANDEGISEIAPSTTAGPMNTTAAALPDMNEEARDELARGDLEDHREQTAKPRRSAKRVNKKAARKKAAKKTARKPAKKRAARKRKE